MIDNAWKEHLRSLDELKTSVQAAGFEQKDPLVVYKVEAYGLFEGFISDINREVVSFLSKGDIPIRNEEDVRQARVPTRRQRRTEGSTNRQEPQAAAAAAGQKKPQTVRRTEKKINRNAACPCGSGKKYKQCHGKR